MTATMKSCGSCRWLGLPISMIERWYITFRCAAPVPDSAQRVCAVNADDGTTCPVYAPRGTPAWRVVMEWPEGDAVTADRVEARYRRLASILHPDKPGGSHEALAELNRARDEALKEVADG